jgi:stage II sporulation protein D
MIKRSLLFALFLAACTTLYAQGNRFRVQLNYGLKVSSVIISPLSTEYNIYYDGKLLNDVDPGSVLELVQEGDSIRIKTLERTLGKCASLKLLAKNSACSFKLKTIAPLSRVRTYPDNVEISIAFKTLRIINVLDVEDYIAGVVEAESGTKTTSEYYKLQAILCRTYALSHMRRHEAEGFHICDQVHCQAFKGRTLDTDIINAVEDTRGLVIVDSDLNLITAAFHSNCGGQTVNSEDVWALPVPYLKAVRDTFCLAMPHAKWVRKIATEDWMSYLALKHKYPVQDSVSFINAVNYPQDIRSIYFIDKGLKIPLKTIRSDWQLKSTYFSIQQKSDSVIFTGKGYGHGVGLCQEGAMRMAKLGYVYKDILHFYYKDVHLVDLSVLEFFRKE